ncbi:MAG: hydantoinase B/oxoprolinase family protein [Erythrobacter sp.]|uniref:hydantoinase B/oxoprolinase family protein n=1 Tax=Erythrobacter sp. TaxID=1042 RepID=UPI00261696F9|nr:hydantoinase B/oxoprolinase family protein [Erythrobacter sp.]MDJ0979670.1 hydantoinase B/oxoprolinase family protein [Erythrobacter sp.]
MAGWQFWIDRGGTFTDIVARGPTGAVETRKYLSHNPESYEDAAVYGVRQLLGLSQDEPIPAGALDAVKMGTTVATNALLERAGEPTLLAITQGLADAIEIGHQARPETFALDIQKPAALYGDVIEIDERVLADGTVDRPLDLDDARARLLEGFDKGYRALAIVLMHAFKHPANERAVAELAREIGYTQVSTSHEVSPLSKIVPRGQTTVVDAYLTPVLKRYIDQVENGLECEGEAVRLLFMQSSGGLTAASCFRGRDAILSGPAGGIIGSVATAKAAGFDKVIGFDMGGTSTDVSHYAGQLEKAYETEVAGAAMRVPMLAIHTVAAGGGSLLRYEGGRLRVGPESAGADPGPACYRRGGALAVTDINAALGKLDARFFPAIFGPEQDQPLDVEASRAGFQRLAEAIGDGRSVEEVAEGFLEIAVERMAQAIKQVSLARGYDVSGYALNCFGGAGGQHACLVAERLGIARVLIHPFAGVLSAYGMGLADVSVERQKVIDQPLEDTLEPVLIAHVTALEEACRAELVEQGADPAATRTSATALLRYRGTDTVLTVGLANAATMIADFEEAHARQYGFIAREKEIALDTLVVEVSAGGAKAGEELAPLVETAPRPTARTRFYSRGEWREAPVFAIDDLGPGHQIAGPAIVTEPTGTIVIEPGWGGTINTLGHLVLSAEGSGKTGFADPSVADPVALELFNNRYMSIAEQMGIVLRNTAQSVNVKERLDFSCAIFDARGNLVANAPHVPVHLGSMDETVRSVLASGQSIHPGDAFVQNNPHAGGSHLPDITVVSPVFDAEGRAILFFVASRAHHEDVGGLSPGSMSPRGRSIHEEGVLLDNIKLVEAGEFQTQAIEAALSAGPYPARNVGQNVADLMAQVAANAAGANELRKLVADYGLEVVQAYMGHIQDNAAEAVRRSLGALEDGAFTLEVDSGARIEVAVRVDRSSRTACIDFTGTSAQQESAFNAPAAVTRAAVLYVIRCLVADEIPLNAGCLRPIEIVMPKGSMLNPRFPAAVVAGNVETSQAVTDALFAAFGRLGTAQGTMNNLTFGNARVQYYETICSGAPAGSGFDGAAGVHTHMTNTRMTDPEVLEARFLVVLEAFAIDRGSGGRGQWCAGDGVTRRIRFLDKMECSILSDRRRVPAPGLKGGEAGRLGRNTLVRAGGGEEDLGGCGEASVGPGDAVIIRTPTGGGYGPASKRGS